MAKQFGVTDEIYFQCKTCKKFVFKVLGAITHLKRKHGINSKMDELEEHFTVARNPPQEVIDTVKKKSDYQKSWRDQRRANARSGSQGPAKPNGPHYECHDCGKVVKDKQAAYGHARRCHNKVASEVGFTETDKPVSGSSHSKSARTPFSPSSLMNNTPRLVKITNSKATETGLLLTVEIEIPTPYLAAMVVPTLT